MLDRRSFLQALAACGMAGVSPVRAQAPAAPRFTQNPFQLGVASGYPRPDGMVLWTRLLGDFAPAPIPVHWEISGSENFSAIVASGNASASPEWAHSVHVEPKG